MIRHSFTLRVLAISFIFLALPLLVDSFIFFQNSYSDSIQDAKNELKEVANFRMITLSEIQPVKQILLKELIYILNLEEGLSHISPEKLNEELDAIVETENEYEIFILEPEDKGSKYRIFATSRDNQRGEYFKSFQQVNRVLTNGEGIFLRYVYSPVKEKFIPHVFTARVIKSKESGETIGIIMTMSDVQNELSSLISQNNLKNLNFAVLNGDGIVFAASDARLKGNYFEKLTSQERERIQESHEMGDLAIPNTSLEVIKVDDPPFFEFIFQNKVQIAYRTQFPASAISIAVYSAKERLFAEAIRHFLIIYIIFGMILIVGGGVTFLFSSWISRPLRNLTFLMGEVSQGILDKRFKEEPFGFEINMLGKIFNSTLDSILDHMQKAENERVQNLVYQRELKIGREVQQNLLPQSFPKLNDVEFSGSYLQGSEVGGEFYGWRIFKSNEGREYLLLGIADASGKGIPACLYALGIRSLIRTYATLYQTIGDVLSQTNNAFLKDIGDRGMFATVIAGILSFDSKVFSYYSCGHPPTFVIRANGEIETLAQSGIALGLIKSNGYQEDQIQLAPGDMIFFYTEGLLHLMNRENQTFGEQGIRRFLLSKKWQNTQYLIDSLAEEVRLFSEGVEEVDDIVIAALMIKEKI